MEMWRASRQHILPVPMLTNGASRRSSCAAPTSEGGLPAEDDQRKVDRHDESDGARPAPSHLAAGCYRAVPRVMAPTDHGQRSSPPTVKARHDRQHHCIWCWPACDAPEGVKGISCSWCRSSLLNADGAGGPATCIASPSARWAFRRRPCWPLATTAAPSAVPSSA